MKSLLSIRDVHRANHLLNEGSPPSTGLDIEALRGRLTELSVELGHAPVTLAVELIAQSQQIDEPAAWIGSSTSVFYPPDAADWGLDWSALAVLHLHDAHRAGRAADKLLRSGAFGVIIVDLIGFRHSSLPAPLLGRLLRLAKTHDSAAVFLTSSADSSPSVSPLVALRVQTRWRRVDPARLRCDCTVVKDKRRGPGHHFCEAYDGPLGLR